VQVFQPINDNFSYFITGWIGLALNVQLKIYKNQSDKRRVQEYILRRFDGLIPDHKVLTIESIETIHDNSELAHDSVVQ